jgi:glycosyltransferase involved in cell wall biosynthesis
VDEADNRIAAVIPAYNEGRVIERVVGAACQFMPVIVIDDGSDDQTGERARSAGATVIRHTVNQGKGAALRTGFAWAIERDLDAVVTIDADAQHNPAEIPKFLAVYRASGADLIIGQRDFSKMPFPRRYSNPFGSWLLSKVLAEPIPDNQCGYRLYGRRLLEILDHQTVGFEFEVEVIGAALKHDLSIAWVKIETIYHGDTRSYFHPIRDSARFLRTVWRARQWRRPKVDPGHSTEDASSHFV